MRDELRRLNAIAATIQMPVKTTLRNHEIELVFNSFADSVQFRTEAFGELESGVYRHSHRFNGGVPWERWMLTAERFLRDQDIQYHIEMSDSKHIFVFQDPYAHAVFAEMAFQGVFDRAARQSDQEAQDRYECIIQKVAEEIRRERDLNRDGSPPTPEH